MHRISPNNPVRRRLFTDDNVTLAEQARIDNFANVLQESAARDKLEKTRKWNFDFENDVPLEGTYEWFRSDGVYDWIGIKADTKFDCEDEDDANEEDKFLPMKLENEVTPKTKIEETAPLLRKRRKDDLNSTGEKEKGVRRRISFD